MILSYVNTESQYVTVREVATHLRLISANEDISVIPVAESSYVSGIISAAFKIASEYVGYSIKKANAIYLFKSLLNGDKVFIPSRVLSVTSVKYYDADGVLTDADYKDTGTQYNPFGLYIEFNTVPDNLDIVVEVVEGFEVKTAQEDGEDVDSWKVFSDDIKSAIFMICANLYDNRQDDIIGTINSTLPMNSKYLLNPYAIRIFV